MNSFAALDSDNEDEVVVQKPAKKEAAKVVPAVAAAPVKAAPASSAKPVKTTGAPAAPRAPKEGGSSAPRTDRPPRAAFTGAEGEASKEDNRGGGRGQGGRGGKEYRSRGGRGADGAPRENAEGSENRPKRTYERRSATGRGRGEQSKGGRGAHGFGNVDQEALEAEKDPASAAPATEEGAEAEAPAEPVVEAEPEPVALTMEEFLAKRAESRANGDMFGEKKGTRATETDLSGLQKKENEVLGIYGNFGAVKDSKATHKDQRSTGKTQVLDVSFRNASLENQGRDDDRPPRAGRGEGRGDRGEGRGGRGGRGEGRGPRPQASSAPRAAGGKLDISDSSAFPSL